MQRQHAGMLEIAGSNDQFAALFVLEIMFAAKGYRIDESAATEIRFQAAGRIIDTRMDDATAVAGLVYSHVAFLFDEQQLAMRPALQQLPRRRQANDPAANYYEIIFDGAGIHAPVSI